MSAGVALKHERIAAVLAGEIRSGAVARGARLPGEAALAQRFAVSRNTVRSALTELGDAGLIATRSGKGSFVLFDSRDLDAREGWARALSAGGAGVRVRLLDITSPLERALARRLGLNTDRFTVVRRVRERPDASVVSYERSFLPDVPALAGLADRGLVEDSLTTTLARAGLFESRGTQRVRARALAAGEATVLNRDPGAWFLDVERTSWTVDGQLVEHVHSLLDPAHFEVEVAWTH